MSNFYSPASASTTEIGETLFVIDRSVDGFAKLRSAIGNDADVVLIDSDEDGVARIGEALAARPGVRELHVISHARPGKLQLGTTMLDRQSIRGRSRELASWAERLAPNAAILLYGCELASDGSRMLHELSSITGATVAASTDVTGSADQGGNWDLEFATGRPDSGTPLAPLLENLKNIRLALPAGFSDELVLGNLAQPVAMQQLPSGQMLVVERQGRIVITDPSVTPAVATTYMALPDVDNSGEKGIISIAIDPNFEVNNYFYLYYHNLAVDRARVSRFIHDVDHAHPTDEFVIWEDTYPLSSQIVGDHWGGGFGFGPDGYLYLAIGDRKDFPADAQDLTLAAGKILRFDAAGADTGFGEWVQGSDNPHLVPDDNPYIDGPGGIPDEIWALGLRNPFRAFWDLPSGYFYIGEVGDNIQTGPDASHEDIHRVTTADAMANFGWPNCEGPDCVPAEPANYSPPIFSIQHTTSRSITMGPVYRGSQFPSIYNGALFFADFTRGWLRYLTFDGAGNVDPGVPVGAHIFSDFGDLGRPVDLEVGADEALYYVDIAGRTATGNGELRRIVFNDSNAPPVITQASADTQNSPTPPLTVTFTGVATDPEGQPLTYTWDFGDGNQDTGAVVMHTYTAKGSYNAILRVSDDLRTSTASPIIIQVGDAPVPTIEEPADASPFRAGDVIQIRGTGTDADGSLTNDDFRWTIRFGHDDHFHPVISSVPGTPCAPAGSTCTSLTIPETGHDFRDDTSFEIRLDVTDSDGITGTDIVTIEPEKVDITFDSNVPGGVTFFIDSLPRNGPITFDSLIGFQHTVSAPPSVSVGGDVYVFDSWSFGPTTPTQVVIVPDVDATYTASYTNIGSAPRVTAGLLALYSFDNGSGSTVSDESGVGVPIDLTIANPSNVSWGPGTLTVNSPTLISSGGAASKLNNSIPPNNALTVEAWVSPANNTQTGPARIVSLSSSPSLRNVTLGQGSSGGTPGDRFNVRLRTTTTGQNGFNPSLTSSAGSLQTSLSHVVYTRNAAGNASIYVNNVAVANGTIGGNLSNWASSYPLILANENSGDRPWLGTFDLVAFYDRALSPSEVAQNFNAGSGGIGNTPPIALDDDFTTDESSVVAGNLLDDNGNGADSDPDMHPLVVSHVNGDSGAVGNPTAIASGAIVTVNANGDFSYNPNGRFGSLDVGEQASDQFSYTISDGSFGSATATVNVTINGIDDPFSFIFLGSSNYGLDNPHDVKLSPDNSQLFVSDVENDRVVVLNADTLEYISEWGNDHQDGTHDVDFDTAGRAYVADTFNHRATIYDIDVPTGVGTLVGSLSAPGLEKVEGVLVHSNGNVYVTGVDSNNLVVFDSAGAVVNSSEFSEVGGLSFPHDVEESPSGDVWLADSENHRMLLVDPDTLTVINEYAGPAYRFNGVRYQDIRPDGTLVVADKNTHTIKVIDPAGNLVHVIGTEGTPGFGPGLFTTPEGVEILGDIVWFADSGNDRVVKYWMIPAGSDPAPIAGDDSSSVVDGRSVTIDVLSNDIDNGALVPSSVAIQDAPANGTISVNSTTGEITYTHNGTGPGSDSFTYIVEDDAGQPSNAATVRVTITEDASGLPTAGLVLHLEADSGVATTGSTVNAWSDLSGFGNHLVAAGNPQLVNETPNGQAAIDFDGSGDKLERTATLNGFPSGNDDRTALIVVNYRSNGYGGFAFGTGFGPPHTCNQTFGLIVHRLGNLMVQGWCDDFNSGDPGNGQGWLIQSAIHSSGQLTHFRDGAPIDSRTHNYNTILSNLVVGAELDSNPFMDMQVAAVVVYDRALDPLEHDSAVTYLQNRYFNAVPVNIPPVAGNDPFASVADGASVDIDVLSNDSDPDGSLDISSVAIIDSPAFGTATPNPATGIVTYAHDGSGPGTDSFTYVVSDNEGSPSNVATVTITIDATPPIDLSTCGPGDPTGCVVSLFDGSSLDGAYTWLQGSGYSDPLQVVSVSNGMLRISGEDVGSVASDDAFRNYALVLEYRWGDETFPPREFNALDAGIIVHSKGIDGGWNSRFMGGIQSQIVEGSNGDFILLHGEDAGGNPLPQSITADAVQVACTFDTWNCRGGYVWQSGAPSQLFDQDLGHIHWYGWDPDWEDVLGFRGDTVLESPTGEWNQMIVVANGDTLQIWFNGTLVNEAEFVMPMDGRVQLESEFAEYFVRRWELWPLDQQPVPVRPTSITSEILPNGVTGVPYDTDIQTIGDLAIVSWQVESGTLPDGVVLDPATGNLAGIPTTAGPGNFTVSATDESGATDTQALSININVGTVNIPPTADDDSATVAQGGSAEVDVLTNDTDVDGTLDPASIIIVDNPAFGTATPNPVTGIVTYAHDGSAPGGDTFTYTVDDDDGDTSNLATVTVTIEAPNVPPTANDDPLPEVLVGGSIDIDVVANDADPDGGIDPTTVAIDSGPTDGTVDVDPVTGVVTYTHTGIAAGADSFTYTVRDDDDDESNTATVTVTIVEPPNIPPVAQDDPLAMVADGGSVDIDVLTNDSDADGTLDPATVVIVAMPSLGTAVPDAITGIVTYTHTGGGGGSDTFTYTVNDDDGDPSNIGTVTVTIEPPNVPPVANDDPSASVEDSDAIDIDVLANDTDSDGTLDPTSVVITATPAFGTAVPHPVTGIVTYTHTGGGAGTDTFSYTVADDDGDPSNVATVTVTIEPPNVAPVANDDPSETVTIGNSVDIDVLTNDNDSDGSVDPTTVVIVTPPNMGMAIADPLTGVVTYTHTDVGAGIDFFTYTVDDDDGDTSNVATVTITVEEPSNVAPVANDDPGVVVNEGEAVDITVLANDSDSDGSLDPTTVTLVSLPTVGTAVADLSTGVVTYTHTGSGPGSDSFTYTVDDDDGETSNIATVSITIEVPGSGIPSAGLVLRLEAGSGVSVTGSTVNGWADQSTEGNDLVAEGNPQLLSGALNGNDVIDFDGSGDMLERTATLQGFPSGGEDRTAYIVVNYRSNGFGGFAYGTNSCNQTFGLIVHRLGNLMVQGWCDDFNSGDPGNGQGWLIQSAVVASGQVSHYRDGTLIDTRVHTYNTVLSNLVIGAELDGVPDIDMQIAAAIVYDRALSSIEQDQVLDYLQTKYFNAGGGNVPPVANDDPTPTVAVGAFTDINVLANDSDSDGVLDPTSVTIGTSPTLGTAVPNPVTGIVRYTHVGAAPDTDTFTYQVSDNDGDPSNEATVTVTITDPGGGLPTDGLVLRLESDQGVTAAGSTVSAWNDQSGFGNHLTAAGNPQWLPSTPNGQLAIEFDGAGDKLERTAGISGLPSGGAARSMFVVVEYRSNGFGGFAYGTGVGPPHSCNQAFGLIVHKFGNLMVQGWCSDFNSGDLGNGQGWMVQSVVYTGSALTHYRDGAEIDARNHVFNTVISNMVVGAELDSVPFMDMSVAAILVYDQALSPADHQLVVNYLQVKYLSN